MNWLKQRSGLFLVVLLLIGLLTSCIESHQLKKRFVNPPNQFKPMPFWHINGELTKDGIRRQLKDARDLAGFTGVSLLPLASNGKKKGTSPKFLTEEYFQRYQDLIDAAQELHMEVILYDDNDFPSGMAGGRMEKHHSAYTMKRLDLIEKEIKGPQLFSDTIPGIQLMSAVAMNTSTLERVELSGYVNNMQLRWPVPEGNWKIMLFPLMKDSFHKKYLCVDFMDTVAVRHMIENTYDKYYQRFGKYFGNTIKMTFFDDVGFWRHPRSWTARFNDKFEELNGFDPRPFYPALWFDIGPDTEAVRNAFFVTRAELLAEGFPKLVGEWAAKHKVQDTGHPPGNYDPTPIDMNGDIFKFYRHTAIPLTDDIISYEFGKDGHKLVSSAADFYDKPIVATEVYGAYREAEFDSLMLYRSVMDLYTRGVNLIIPHGMWYDPNKVYIQPLVSPYSKKIASALPSYSDFIGRTSMMLRGGRRVSEIGVLYPFEELAGWFRFDNPDSVRQGFYVSPVTDYMNISNWLTNDIRRDFTFIHPELFLDEKYKILDGEVLLANRENQQKYHTIVMTGSKIVSYKTLKKLQEFYMSGGTLIATTELPFKSSELGQDDEVIKIIKEMFGIDPLNQDSCDEVVLSKNDVNGKALFLPNPNVELLTTVFEKNTDLPDVWFANHVKSNGGIGKFNYIHKVNNGRDIYYFTNSSDQEINTEVTFKGRLELDNWNPHNGSFTDIDYINYSQKDGQYFTTCSLNLNPVSSTFYVTTK